MKKIFYFTMIVIIMVNLQGCGVLNENNQDKVSKSDEIQTAQFVASPKPYEEKSATNSSNVKRDKKVSYPDEAIKLIANHSAVKLGYAYSTEGYHCCGTDSKTGFYLISWANPGKGSGGGWEVDPYTGDVYQMGKKTFNLFDVPFDNTPILIFYNKKYNLNTELIFSSEDRLTKEQLGFLRNGIYAKYGYKFKTKEYSEYFSKIDWYRPSHDNVDGLLNEVDKKNIQLILEQERKFNFRSNEQDKIIENGESFTFQINNTMKKLFVYKEPLTGIKGGNNPLKIILRIEGSQIEFINNINDGVDVYMTDFDIDDGKVDICVTQNHLDIGRTTSIYTYDGYRIEKHTDIAHLGWKLLYDQKGKIYFWYSPTDKIQFDYCYDYKVKESYKLKSAIYTDSNSQ